MSAVFMGTMTKHEVTDCLKRSKFPTMKRTTLWSIYFCWRQMCLKPGLRSTLQQAGEEDLGNWWVKLGMEDYDLGLEPCSRKMASRDPLGAFGKRSQSGPRAPMHRLIITPLICKKEPQIS
ncbi:uncharacterized protein ACBT57_025334 isoform 1-T3 [Dama dama]